jgi:hypothetical protein
MRYGRRNTCHLGPYTIHHIHHLTPDQTHPLDRSIAKYTRDYLTTCQQDVFALLVPSCWQVWNKLLSSCDKVDEANRLATSCSNKSDIVCT